MKQGDALPCQLFNLKLEKAVRESRIQTDKTIFTRTVILLTHSDGIDIVEISRSAVVDTFCALETAAEMMGLTVTEGKTKLMMVSDKNSIQGPLKINNYRFEQVQHFRYLVHCS